MEVYGGSIGRRYVEDVDTLIQDPFLNDWSKIKHSKAYRQLSEKAQVIPLSGNSYVRHRGSHTGEVEAISVAISELLGLNTNLCRAISVGHDTGHIPYGHLGEEKLWEIIGDKSFRHSTFGVVRSQHIERKGKGLNLTYETLRGILGSSRGSEPLTVEENVPQEYSVVMFADKIAYTFSDLGDALRYGGLEIIPETALKLGEYSSTDQQRICTKKCIEALVSERKGKSSVQFSEGEVFENFNLLRNFMYEEVYTKVDLETQRAIFMKLYEVLNNEKDELGVDPVVAISLFTDNELKRFNDNSEGKRNFKLRDIGHFGLFEILDSFEKAGRSLKLKGLSATNPDLDWEKEAIPDGTYEPVV